MLWTRAILLALDYLPPGFINVREKNQFYSFKLIFFRVFNQLDLTFF